TAVTPNPATAGQNVTLSAHAGPRTDAGDGFPTWIVFYDGAVEIGRAIADASGNATVTASLAQAGTHSLTAAFEGRLAVKSSTSAVTSLVVNKTTSTTTVTSASPNPAYQDQNVTLTATVAGSVPTGSV